MIQAIILLGGRGTRIRRLFPDRPKALVPVVGQPFLARQLHWLTRQGIGDIHLAAGYLAPAIADWIQTQKFSRAKLTCSTEPVPLSTAGGLKFVEPYIRSDPFLVLNGDTLLPGLDIAALALAHAQARPLASIAVTRISATGRYGSIEFDMERRIRAFHEKAEQPAGWVNGGVYLMNNKALAGIESGRSMSLETDIFPPLAAQGLLRAFPVPPPLLDMGTPEGLAAMERFFRGGPKHHEPRRSQRKKDNGEFP